MRKYAWDKIPDTEIETLARNLNKHLKDINITMSKKERLDFVKNLLKKTKLYMCF